MKLKELLNGVNVIETNADLNIEIKGLCYNSEFCGKDYIYFARKGFKYDGFRFVPRAIEKGVSLVVGEQSVPGVSYVKVSDILEAQAKISANFYGNPQNFLKIIGITGTDGKTTTSYMVSKGLNAGLISTVEIKTGNKTRKAVLTTPESTDIFKYLREMVDYGYKYAVIEVSAHALSRKRVFGIPFNCAVFTNFSQDHLDFYKTMDNYFEAKKQLFINLSSEGFCVVNRDDKKFETLKSQCKGKKVLSFGKDSQSDIVIKEIKNLATGLKINYLIEGQSKNVSLPLIGDYNAYNLAAAMGVALGFGESLDRFIDKIEKDFSVPGRVEFVPLKNGFGIIVDFAHTPGGLENLLSSVKKHTEGRIITVFGCGGERDRTKRPLMLEAVCKYSDIAVVTADNPRGENIKDIFEDIKKGETFGKKVYYIEDRKEAIKKALIEAKKGDIVVLAGKGHEEYQQIGDKKIPFSDKKVALEILERL